nr:MAG TPA: hypothetical protein [Caudoviricetes sp.]
MEQEITTLVFKIDNKKPVELLSLTRSMLSVTSQFDKFNIEKGQNSEAKLYVKEVRKGSIIIELFDISLLSGVIPFVENINVVAEFAGHLKNVFDYYKGDEVSKEENKPILSISDCEDFSNMINPVALDGGAVLNIQVSGNQKCNVNINIPSMEANAIQNGLKREKEMLKQKELKGVEHKQILTLYQAVDKKKGNKGIIESLNKKPLGLIFENDDDREKILSNPIQNPLKYAFIVDVRVEEINNTPSAYRILKYYEDEGFEL